MEFPALAAVAERLIAAEAAYDQVRASCSADGEFTRAWQEVMQARALYREAFTPATVLAVIRHANVGAAR